MTDPSPDSESGFHGVYKHNSAWVAKALGRPVAPVSRTPREAAIDLAKWWKYWFGPDWPDFYAARKWIPWRIVKIDGGYRVFVYVLGKLTYLGKGQRGQLFATETEAEAAMRRWIKDQFGLFEPVAGLILRRRRYRSKPVQFPHRGSR